MGATKKKGELWISASQLDTFASCPRKWWFQKVLKLPETPKGYFTFGTILHECLERYELSTEQGRVPENPRECFRGQKPGAVADLFPEGWEEIEERGRKVRVTPNEAQLIKKLVTEAIEKGVVTRDPKDEIEREILEDVIPGVKIIGYIDRYRPGLNPPEVHDHKTFSQGSVRFLKQPGPTDEGGNLIPIMAPFKADDGTSPNSIGHNQQVLTYAAMASIADGYEGPMKVRHNQFPKFSDRRGVRTVEALVSATRIAEHWEEIQATAERMVRVGKIKRWEDTPPPESKDACRAYGGCPFADICGMRTTPDNYRVKVERAIEKLDANERPNLPLVQTGAAARRRRAKDRDGTMTSIFDRAKKQKAARGQTKAKAKGSAPKGINGGAAKKESAPEETAPVVGAPWAKSTCPACKGSGFNSKGAACAICDKTAAKRGAPTSEMYAIEHTDAGPVAVGIDEDALEALGAPLMWSQAEGASGAPEPQEEPEAEEPQEEPQEEPEEAEAEESSEEPEAQEEAEEAPEQPEEAEAEEAPAKEKPKRQKKSKGGARSGAGRPRAGVIILRSSTMLVGPSRPVVLGQSLLEEVGAEMAEDMGARSFWELDTWKRRDRLRQAGETIAERLSRSILVLPRIADPDMDALVAGILPHAEMVVEGS